MTESGIENSGNTGILTDAENREDQQAAADVALMRRWVSEAYGKKLTQQSESSWGAEYFRRMFGEDRGNELAGAWEALANKGFSGSDMLQEFMITQCTQSEGRVLVSLDNREFSDVRGYCPQCFQTVRIMETEDGGRVCEACGYRAGNDIRVPVCITFAGPETAAAEGTE